MKKNLIILLACLWSFLPIAVNGLPASQCPGALDTSDPSFCPSFRAAQICYCYEQLGTVSGFFSCNNINSIYSWILKSYPSVKEACVSQSNVSVETCMDEWSCYLMGGQDHLGRLCSETGAACDLKTVDTNLFVIPQKP